MNNYSVARPVFSKLRSPAVFCAASTGTVTCHCAILRVRAAAPTKLHHVVVAKRAASVIKAVVPLFVQRGRRPPQSSGRAALNVVCDRRVRHIRRQSPALAGRAAGTFVVVVVVVGARCCRLVFCQ